MNFSCITIGLSLDGSALKEPLTKESGAGITQEMDTAPQASLEKLQRKKKKIKGDAIVTKRGDILMKGG